MKSLYLGIAAAVVLSACSSTGTMAPVENRNQPGLNSPGSGPGAGNAVGPNGIGVSNAPPIKDGTTARVNEAQNPSRTTDTQVGKSIFFDYNEFVVKPEYQDMLRQNFGGQKISAPIRLEGNADERGSSEYNLALGQKRSEAVKKQLMVLGVPEAQLEAVSFGSEKPRETCHEERCWAVNRRVDLMRLGR